MAIVWGIEMFWGMTILFKCTIFWSIAMFTNVIPAFPFAVSHTSSAAVVWSAGTG